MDSLYILCEKYLLQITNRLSIYTNFTITITGMDPIKHVDLLQEKLYDSEEKLMDVISLIL